ncbi:hypothetical protein POTOM_059173 [Populus tomentosa]|uniref:Uncharacterized protein n=1 Tax=Populus tomentosa TaxID=118781 RepID=A0A8X8C1V7_POPTO|nr:hypothetical protein POTOM_059173 [Populus tomentosa]
MPLEPLLNPYITMRGPADNLKSHHGGNIIESYQEVAGKGSCPINVKVVKQVTDPEHSAGKVITSDLIQQLLQKVTDGDSNAIPVLLTDRDAQMQGRWLKLLLTHMRLHFSRTAAIMPIKLLRLHQLAVAFLEAELSMATPEKAEVESIYLHGFSQFIPCRR